MKKIQRASLSEVQNKALPILSTGFHKRHSLRTVPEEAKRSPEKTARDRKTQIRPHISAI